MRAGSFVRFLSLLPAAEPQRPPVLTAMKAELDRSTEFRGRPTPPHFLSYEITELGTHNVAANFGIDLRCRRGYHLDNTHRIRGSMENILDRGCAFSTRGWSA